MREDFALIRDLIDEQAFFRFNDGDFVGRAAIQAAFEKTWRGDPSVHKARFFLTDIVVLTTDVRTATATYTWIGRVRRARNPSRSAAAARACSSPKATASGSCTST